MSRVPHIVSIVLAFIAAAITTALALQGKGEIALPVGVVSALTIANTLIGNLVDSWSTVSARLRARDSLAPKSGARGFVGLGLLVQLGVLAAVLLLCVMIAGGCFKEQTPAQQVSDIETAIACTQGHWGEPLPQLAGECFNADVTAAEDVVADIEAIAEGKLVLGGEGDVLPRLRKVFPYASNAKVLALVDQKRGNWLALQYAEGGAR